MYYLHQLEWLHSGYVPLFCLLDWYCTAIRIHVGLPVPCCNYISNESQEKKGRSSSRLPVCLGRVFIHTRGAEKPSNATVEMRTVVSSSAFPMSRPDLRPARASVIAFIEHSLNYARRVVLPTSQSLLFKRTWMMSWVIFCYSLVWFKECCRRH